MPRVRLTDTFRVQNGIEVPSADPSKRLRGDFVELTEQELSALKDELGEGGKFPDLSEKNLDVYRAGSAAQEPSEVSATDAAAKLAREHDLDLSAVEGTGENGRVLKGDVEDALEPSENDSDESDGE